jgi:hypothetical protein
MGFSQTIFMKKDLKFVLTESVLNDFIISKNKDDIHKLDSCIFKDDPDFKSDIMTTTLTIDNKSFYISRGYIKNEWGFTPRCYELKIDSCKATLLMGYECILIGSQFDEIVKRCMNQINNFAIEQNCNSQQSK